MARHSELCHLAGGSFLRLRLALYDVLDRTDMGQSILPVVVDIRKDSDKHFANLLLYSPSPLAVRLG
jgi:hypothetical protein